MPFRRAHRAFSFLPILSLNAALCIPANRAASAAPAPKIAITVDDTVITRLLQLVAKHDDSDESVDAWIDLPGNAELLKVGATENLLTRAQLKTNVKAVIDGAAADANQPRYSFGRVVLSPPAEYQTMIDELHRREGVWIARCQSRDAMYAPSGADIRQTVYLHLGGDWDAINRDGAIFINVHFFHDYFTPSWFGLNLLISHETFHAVQNQIFGNPESTDSSDDAFYTALSKIQREGTARLVEVDADQDGYSANTYGFFFRAVDNESIRQFPAVISLLSGLSGACYPDLNFDTYQSQIASGLSDGGPYYTLGEGIAQAIEQYGGRDRLIDTVKKGPIDFFECYADLSKRHSELPQIPPDALKRIDHLRSVSKNGKLNLPNQPSANSTKH